MKLGAAAVGVLGILVLLALPAQYGLGDDSAPPGTATGPLDGMRFVGEFGPEGKPADFTDAMSFGDGQFEDLHPLRLSTGRLLGPICRRRHPLSRCPGESRTGALRL